ncbi:hypothetical protein [Sphingomonas flavescens]|uniref:hypothetical protein n=1 Tax=Sphingomonas flavescens TaxID=3132797 RepID=UPI002804658A|nr:hypothetical protein [Sphingomonas limnosediminicola]
MRVIAALAMAAAVATAASAQTYVHGYTRGDGTYVAPHYRSSPDSSLLNNYSTRGNVNPYTGQVGTRDPYAQPSRAPSFGNYSNPYSTSPTQPRSNSSCIFASPC